MQESKEGAGARMKNIISIWRRKSQSERKLIKTAGSMSINGFTGIYKIFLGLYYLSDWLFVNGLYYLILSIAKVGILKKYQKIRLSKEQNKAIEEIRLFQKTGAFLIMLGISYFGVSLHSLLTGETISYPPYIRYVMILIAFGKIFFSIYGIYQTSKMKSPVILAVRIVDATDAVVSLIAVRCVLQVMKGVGFAVESTAILGIICSILFQIIGIWMMKKQEKENG